MEHPDWLSLIGNLGFPIFVSWYLLTKVESRIEALSSSIAEMAQAIRRMEEGSVRWREPDRRREGLALGKTTVNKTSL
jgi:hypothetical protein